VKVRFLDLSIEDKNRREEILGAIEEVLKHGMLVLGPEVEKLEKKVADYCGVKYAVGVNSGTDALFIALKSLGIGEGYEVITTCFSFVGTANSIALTGARPVFADIRNDMNIDPDGIEELITHRTRALVPVHFTGKICNMEAIDAIAKKHGLTVVEDAAQSFGASVKNRRAGAFGKIAAFSMNPMKVYAACGEAGMVVTDSRDLYEKALSLRYNGLKNGAEAVYRSLNGRLDTLQAAVLLKRLNYFEEDIECRRTAAVIYNEGLKDFVQIPVEQPGSRDIYYTYQIKTSKRAELMEYLKESGIETKIRQPLLIPEHEAYKEKDISEKYPVGKKIAHTSLCLPISEKITKEEIEYVIEKIRFFFQDNK